MERELDIHGSDVWGDAPLELLEDAQLLSLARDGSEPSFGVLFARYRDPAERFARYLGMGAESSDVVAETFTQIFDLLQRGKGPEQAFRAYMFTTIRHEAGRRAKTRKRVIPTDDSSHLDTPVAFGAGELDAFERALVRRAYESLPPRWRSVLWAIDVDGRSPGEVAEQVGMQPNSISALAYRARLALRESYLHQHAGTEKAVDADCVSTRKSMVATVRGTANVRHRDRVSSHIARCDACFDTHDELVALNFQLPSSTAKTPA